MKRFCFIFLLLYFLILQHVTGQDPFRYSFPDTVPETMRFNSSQVYQYTIENLKKYKDLIRSTQKPVFDEYARAMVREKHQLLYQGNIYIGWKEADEYLQQIVKKLLPPNLKRDSAFQVFIVRDPSPNAFVLYDNSIYINIGLLAVIPDEAGLAGDLAHEMGHYFNYDNYNQFARFMNADKAAAVSPLAGLISGLRAYSFSRKNEAAADKFAIEHLLRTGYSLKSYSDAFLLKDHLEDVYLKRAVYDFPHTHPDSKDRALEITKHPGYNNKNMKTHQVSEIKFQEIKKKAKEEVLHLLLESGDYHGCIAQSFENYLLNPADRFAVYSLLEATRRWKLFNESVADKNFITWIPGKPSAKLLLEDPFEGFLFLRPEDVDNPKTELLNKKVVFETYEQAYNYFLKIAVKLGCSECLLTNALYNIDKPEVFKDQVTLYLASPKPVYKEFAQALANGTVTNKGKKGILYDVYINKIQSIQQQDTTKERKALERLEKYMNGYVPGKINNSPEVSFSIDYNDINTRFAEVQRMNSVNSLNDIVYRSNFRKDPSLIKTRHVVEIPLDLVDPAYWTFAQQHGFSEYITMDLFLTEAHSKSAAGTENEKHKNLQFGFKSSVNKHSLKTSGIKNRYYNLSNYHNGTYGTYKPAELDKLLFPYF